MSQIIMDSRTINAVPVHSPACPINIHSKRSSDRIRLRDCRDLYLLIGECRPLGIDGIAWRRHLTKRLQVLFEVDLVSFIDCRVKEGVYLSSDLLMPFSSIDHGSLDSCPNISADFQLDEGYLAILSGLIQKNPGIQVTTRYDLLHKADENNDQTNQLHGLVAELGDFIVSVNRCTSGRIQLLSFFRQPHKPQFARRMVHLLKALWIEIRNLQPQELRAVESSIFMNYPKRMLQVLSCILAGNTAKETAIILSISVHTVQEHVKRLYKRTGTSNRAELAEFFRDVAPQLMETPLDQFPDHRQKQQGSFGENA